MFTSLEKTKWLAAAMIAVAFSNPAAALVTREADLVGWWMLGENATPAGGVGDPMDTIADMSGNGNTAVGAGTRVDGVAFSPYPDGDSLGSDGTYLAPDAPAYDFGAESFSLSFWARGAPSNYQILANKRNTDPAHPFWQAEPTPGGGMTWNLRDGDANNSEFNIGGALNDQWHHFVLLRDSDAGELRGYRDGVLAGTADAAHVGSIATDTPLGIGAGGDGTGAYDGEVDDFRIYSVALSLEDAEAIYNGGEGDFASIVGLTWGGADGD